MSHRVMVTFFPSDNVKSTAVQMFSKRWLAQLAPPREWHSSCNLFSISDPARSTIPPTPHCVIPHRTVCHLSPWPFVYHNLLLYHIAVHLCIVFAARYNQSVDGCASLSSSCLVLSASPLDRSRCCARSSPFAIVLANNLQSQSLLHVPWIQYILCRPSRTLKLSSSFQTITVHPMQPPKLKAADPVSALGWLLSFIYPSRLCFGIPAFANFPSKPFGIKDILVNLPLRRFAPPLQEHRPTPSPSARSFNFWTCSRWR